MSDSDTKLLMKFEHISKRYTNDIAAVDDFSFAVKTGEFLSLIGPSGCGKSTILRIMAILEAPTAGQIIWNGGEAPPMGFVFQEPTLMPWASVFDNVWLPLRLARVSRQKAREPIIEALKHLNLLEFEQALPRELSGGMKMRVSLARALVTKPQLLLLDEPFAALDEITRFKLNNDLSLLQQTLGMTIIFVSHSVYETVFLSDRILVLSPRPARILECLDVDRSQPRGPEFREEPLFMALANQLSRNLQAGFGA